MENILKERERNMQPVLDEKLIYEVLSAVAEIPCGKVATYGQIARLIGLGAKLVDVGQEADVSWTVLADPDGNEFCVLSSREF